MEEFDQAPFGADEFNIEFANNPEPRISCVLLLDISQSMDGEPISALNRAVQQFAGEVREDRLAAKCLDITVVTFGGTVQLTSPFVSAQEFSPQPLVASGNTPMGEAIGVAIDLTASRQAQYRASGIIPHRPWIFMVTDGAPTDAWKASAKRIEDGANRFSFFAVGVAGADMNTLRDISVLEPVMLNGLMFAQMFTWLSSSLSAVSRSSVGQVTPLANPTSPTGWATI